MWWKYISLNWDKVNSFISHDKYPAGTYLCEVNDGNTRAMCIIWESQ